MRYIPSLCLVVVVCGLRFGGAILTKSAAWLGFLSLLYCLQLIWPKKVNCQT
jgi:hypothetical protein